jgi:hypothetical protein
VAQAQLQRGAGRIWQGRPRQRRQHADHRWRPRARYELAHHHRRSRDDVGGGALDASLPRAFAGFTWRCNRTRHDRAREPGGSGLAVTGLRPPVGVARQIDNALSAAPRSPGLAARVYSSGLAGQWTRGGGKRPAPSPRTASRRQASADGHRSAALARTVCPVGTLRQQNTPRRSARYRISGILPTVGRVATLHGKPPRRTGALFAVSLDGSSSPQC